VVRPATRTCDLLVRSQASAATKTAHVPLIAFRLTAIFGLKDRGPPRFDQDDAFITASEAFNAAVFVRDDLPLSRAAFTRCLSNNGMMERTARAAVTMSPQCLHQ